ncbi:hypothetical protein HanPSC8_Chr16g0730831 [Helianthus annuus]|nr:hypothetical protein HanPSC8_Chr16g0730831 [Helianthus annuus]
MCEIDLPNKSTETYVIFGDSDSTAGMPLGCVKSTCRIKVPKPM